MFLLVASNSNDILTRLFETGEMRMSPVEPTLSPSMDIQVSSNLERLLFELVGNDGASVAASMEEFRDTGRIDFPGEVHSRLREHWRGERVDDVATIDTMRLVYEEAGEVIDPHTAVAVAAARRSTSGS